MGLLDLLLGKSNGISQFVDSNRNAIHGGFAGLGRGYDLGSGLSGFAEGANAGAPADQVYQAAEEAKAERLTQINQTMKFLQAKYPDLAQAVDAGLPIGDAWNEAFKRSTPGYGAKAANEGFTLSDGETRYGPDGSVIATAGPKAEKPREAPNGYEWKPDGTLGFIAGGPADPSTAGKTTEATRRNQQLATVIDPELKSLMGDGQSPGTFDALANGWDQGKSMIPGGNLTPLTATSPQYQQAQDSLKTIVASYLYSVSGATANPGEVQNQVDVLTPKPGDSPERVAAKKARVVQMVEAVKAAATGKPINIDDPTGSQSGGIDDLLTKYGVQ